MEKLKKRKITALTFTVMLLSVFTLITAGCRMPSGQLSAMESGSENASEKAVYSSGSNPLTSSVIEKLEYPFGIKSAATGTDAEINAYLLSQYEEWKSLYVTADGAGPGGTTQAGYLRVQRDNGDYASGAYDTVSEGQAYGMLFAVYFNDEPTFAGLLRYMLMHCDPVDTTDMWKRNDKYPGLMHWLMDANGNETTEFGILRENFPKGDQAYVKVNVEVVDGVEQWYIENPRNPEYMLKSTKPADTATVKWFQASRFDRTKRSSATDADVDIAAALIMASKMWPQKWINGYQYQRHAARYLTSLLAFDVEYKEDDSAFWWRAGNLWGGQDGWNPCYFTPAWFRMFKDFVADNPIYFNDKITLNMVNNDWETPGADDFEFTAMEIIDGVVEHTYQEMLEIDAVNGTAGLYPDWVDTTGASPAKTVGCSDRLYFAQTVLPASATRLYLDMSLDTNNDGIIKFNEALDLQSYNFYYDAVRVPWRIGMDYSYYGDNTAKAIVQKIGNFFKGKHTGSGTNGTAIVDGYAIDGSAWQVADKDGFNMGEGGTAGNDSVTFVAMCATAAMSLNDQANAEAWYEKVKATKEDVTGDYHYYGNCVRLLSLLYMSGRMVNLGDVAQGSIPRPDAAEIEVGPLTIDKSVTDYAAYGTQSILLNDRSAYFNADKTEWANVGAGLKDVTYNQNDKSLIMNIGYGTWINGAVCGLPYLIGRDPKVNDWVLGTGTVYKNRFSAETHPWPQYNRYVDHYQGDPGLMDFSIDMDGFTPDPDNDITVGNGGDTTLPPADYGAVKVMNKSGNTAARLRLSGGTYHMESFTTEPDAEIYFDTSEKPVIIFVQGQLTIRDRSKFLKEAGKGADPSKILIVTGYNGAVTIGPQTNWRGTLIAPNAGYVDVNLHNPFNKALNTTPNPAMYETIENMGIGFGAIWGSNVEIHQDSGIFFTKLDWDAVENIGPNPEIPDPGQGDIIDLTGASSGYMANISQNTSYKIKLGYNGTFQISDAWGDNVKISINGGPQLNKPDEWGGAFTGLGSQTEVLITLVTASSISVSLSWW
ncbi:MAG: hypothetical protein JW874_02895 [Spirochaetales bacterium]|nr:hypothetical protein [Spirochaetales bacterium]